MPKWNGSQRRIGITGGIASGKSTIGNFLKDLKQIPILDADEYSHEELRPETENSNKIIKRYGNNIWKLNENNQREIDRKKLGNIIFSDKKERAWLESITHPVIHQRLLKELENNQNSSAIILIIPLLFETNLTDLCSEIWVVNCSFKQQLKRLMKRDELSKEESIKRIKTQLELGKKIKLADIVIDNSGQEETWINQVNNLVNQF